MTAALSKRGPAIAPCEAEDTGAAAQQTIILSAVASTGVQKPAGAARSVFDLAAKAPSKRGGPRVLLPAIDTLPLAVQAGVPKPRSHCFRSGDSKYAPIFEALKPGHSLALPLAYKGAVYAATVKRTKAGLGKYTVRRVSDTEMRIWQDA